MKVSEIIEFEEIPTSKRAQLQDVMELHKWEIPFCRPTTGIDLCHWMCKHPAFTVNGWSTIEVKVQDEI